MKQYILMCDIIKSSEQIPAELMTQFKKCTEYLNTTYKDLILSPFTITLGDEFQGLCKDLISSTTLIIALEEFIIKNNFQFKLRYVLHYGSIETKINPHIAYEMLGEGLTLARKTLAKMKKDHRRFNILLDQRSLDSLLNNAFHIYENIVDRWKIEEDYELISTFIENKDYKVVADKMQKNRSLMWKREKTLQISSYFSVKEIIQTSSQLLL